MTHRTQLQPTGYLEVEYTGRWGVSEAHKMICSVIERCRCEKMSKVLLDIRKAKGSLSLLEQFEVGTLMVTSAPFIAFAIVSGADQLAQEGLLETVAVNRGGVVKVMTDAKEAATWLNALR